MYKTLIENSNDTFQTDFERKKLRETSTKFINKIFKTNNEYSKFMFFPLDDSSKIRLESILK